MYDELFQIKNVRRYTVYSIYILLSILPAHLFCQVKLPVSTKKITNVAPRRPSSAEYNVMPSYLYPHSFLDTASGASILEFINKTPDSVLQIIEDIGEAVMRDYYQQNRQSENDADGDGHRSIESGGDDCDDFDRDRFPGRAERCNGYTWAPYNGVEKYLLLWRLHDEDCDPTTIDQNQTGYDGDMDGDGQIFCKCVNENRGNYPSPTQIISSTGHVLNVSPSKTHPGKVVYSGVDCDDNNPVIGRNAQTCVGEDSVRVCANGEWITLKCKKCVKQPNGTGVVVEW